MALEQVTGGIKLPLSPAVPSGQRQQDWPTPLSGQAAPLEREQILNPQLGAGPMELRSHRSRRRSGLGRHVGGGLPFDLVSEEHLSFLLRQSSEGGCDRTTLLPLEDLIIWPGGIGQVDQPVCLPPGPFIVAPLRANEVARDHDGVRGECTVVQARLCSHDAYECLLHQIVDDVSFTCPRGNDSTDERGQLPQLPVAQLTHTVSPWRPREAGGAMVRLWTMLC